MTDQEMIVMARLAQHDDRMSTGALYGNLADRTEELVKERDTWREIAHNEAGEAEHNFETMLELSAKLAKAVDALRWYDDPSSQGDVARNVLAELEGEKK